MPDSHATGSRAANETVSTGGGVRPGHGTVGTSCQGLGGYEKSDATGSRAANTCKCGHPITMSPAKGKPFRCGQCGRSSDA